MTFLSGVVTSSVLLILLGRWLHIPEKDLVNLNVHLNSGVPKRVINVYILVFGIYFQRWKNKGISVPLPFLRRKNRELLI